jgi:maltose alpha-D-glucosyltransferase/alpha-amylase
MQWSDEPNAGFSTAPPDRLVRPVVADGEFAFPRVNAMAQRNRHDSLLEHCRRLVDTRRSCPEIGWGGCEVVDVGATGVLALRSEWRGAAVMTLHNLSGEAAEVRLPRDTGPLCRLLGDAADCGPEGATRPLLLDGYGFRWFRIQGARR